MWFSMGSNSLSLALAMTQVFVFCAYQSAFSQSSGDKAPLEAPHPAYESLDMLGDRKIRVGGMDFLPDGRLVVSNWRPQEVWFVDGIYGATAAGMTFTRFAEQKFGIEDLLGLKVVDGKVYVLDKAKILRLDDTNNDGVADVGVTIATGWGYNKATVQELAYGLIYKDGGLHFTLGQGLNPSGFSLQTQVKDRGATLKATLDGKYEIVSMGHRQANGIGFGPDSAIMVVDNQGSWYPSCALVHVKQGRFFGHPNSMHPDYNAKPVTPPVAWFPQDEIGNSSSHPMYLNRGIFAGQMLVGDVRYGGIIRVFVEKVDGEWQGAAFRFGNGLKAGVNRIHMGKDGSLFIGQIGEGPGNHAWMNNREYGLHRWREKANPAPWFEMMAVRSREGGMEVEYTLPVDAAGEVAANYEVKMWGYKGSWNYGGAKQENTTLSVSEVRLSPDRKMAYLKIPGLQTGKVVYIRLKGIKSGTGLAPWTTEAFYTLNAVGKEPIFSKPTARGEVPGVRARLHEGFKARALGNTLEFSMPYDEAFTVELASLRGIMVKTLKAEAAVSATAPGRLRSVTFDRAELASGVYSVTAVMGAYRISTSLAIP